MSRKVSIDVDKTRCVSNLWCVRTLPGVFRVDANGYGEAFDAEGASEDEIVDVGFGCPVEAISVTDAQTGENLLA
jgi:ferredoxin